MTRSFSHIETPQTEGIKYTGSKLKLLPYIIDEVKDLQVKTILDGFSGTTRVSQAFAQIGYDVTANDTSEWSEVFGNCYLKSEKPDSYYKEIIDMLNGLPGYEGWFTEHYGGRDESGKKPFQAHNTMKLDAIRDKIDELGLEWVDKCVILTSLILALDTVDNTLGHYVAYCFQVLMKFRNYQPLLHFHQLVLNFQAGYQCILCHLSEMPFLPPASQMRALYSFALSSPLHIP